MGRPARVANDDVRFARVVTLPVRGLRRESAAAYVGLSPSKFDELVGDGRMPRPSRVDGCVIWDIRKLDLAFDDLSGDHGVPNPWE